MKYTRKQYLNKECTLDEYYGQFVTDKHKAVIRTRWTPQYLAEVYKTNPHFNDSPTTPTMALRYWDRLGIFYVGSETNQKMKELGDYLTLAGQVCVMKTAARQVALEHLAQQGETK